MSTSPIVHIYIFSVNDHRFPQQRLYHAVKDYCDTCGYQVSHETLIIARTETGKPYFPHFPQIHFSISHSGQYWSCAISDQNIGYDLQEHELPKNETHEDMMLRHQKMAIRFFHPLEAEFVATDCHYNFLTVWCAREAYVKYTGQGIDKYFSEHCVIPNSADEWYRISGNTKEIRWIAMGKVFWKSYYCNNYTLCVCTETPCTCAVISCSSP